VTLEEFESQIESAELELIQTYTKKFGVSPPDLDELAFLGSKLNRLKQAIESNQVIEVIIIPEGAEI
tara:strand:+ start:338 stop:538 length:201 start_codon:yes stop_codon:yes gene_type:complete